MRAAKQCSRSTWERARGLGAVALALVVSAAACDCGGPTVEGPSPLGDGFASVRATGAEAVVLELSRDVQEARLAEASFAIANYTVVPPDEVDVRAVAANGPRQIELTTAALSPGQTYTLTVAGLYDTDGYELAGTLNFVGPAGAEVVQVEVRIPDVETARQHGELTLLATVDPESGAFSERLEAFPVTDEGSHFLAVLDVEVDPSRTLDSGDDADPSVDRRPYAVRLVDAAGRPASALVRFVLPNKDAPRTVEVTVRPPPEIPVGPGPEEPLPEPPEDASPEDGRKLVRVVVDDRASRELRSPQLKLSFDSSGNFDASFPQTVDLTPLEGSDGYWHAIVTVAVDPARELDGTSESTFPYFAFLVEQGVEYEGLSVSIVAPDEVPETRPLSLGNPEWTPVTFRVDVSRAYLTLDGSERGVRANEAVFLTGEWQSAVDALGNNAGDAFSGGEQLNLRMRELEGHPGVWTRTLWLPPGRPYGWKVVRCDADEGCGPLNQLVASSGRAFATVMKNLATDNVDAFADPAVGIVDPLAPEATQAGGTTWDYTGASIYEGTGTGGEQDPTGTPDGERLFKQEAPDLVVVVEETPLKTRIYHVGTWRDVNLGLTPAEILATSTPVELGPADYDDGMIGRYPPSREEP